MKVAWLLGAALWAVPSVPVYAQEAAQPPVLTGFVAAEIPPEARRDATVGLVLTVGVDGVVTEAVVSVPAGPPLDDAALAAARRFTFTPAQQHGQPVAARVRYDYVFHAPPPGRLEGQLVGAPGTRVVISDPPGRVVAEVITGADGRFVVDALPAGRYRVHADFVDAVEEVREGEATIVTYRRAAQEKLADGFGATARVAAPEREVTRRSVSREELTTQAGTRGDPLRTIELLPGVARPTGGEGALIVRGAAPEDSQLFVDGAQVIRIYHFGGLTSFAPAGLIDRLELFPGNFSVRYGRATGGAVEVRLRDPRSDGAHAQADVNLLDAGALYETPLGHGWAMAAGFRRSTIDLWYASVADGEGAATTAAPVYLDYQLLLAHRGPKDRVRLQIYGSDDRMGLLLDPVDGDPSVRGALYQQTDFHRAQVVWKHRASERSELELTATLGTFGFDIDVGQAIRQDMRIMDAFTRAEWRGQPASWLRVAAGTDVMFQGGKVYYQGPKIPQAEGNPGDDDELDEMPRADLDYTKGLFRPAVYAEATVLAGAGVELTTGARLDYYDDISAATLDLRTSARWRVKERTTLKAGLGQFSEPPDYGEALPGVGNPSLGPERAVHASVGVEQQLGARASLGVETYAKWIDDMVTGDADGVLQNAGKGRIVGAELAGRVTPGGPLSGFLSYSLSKSERRDADGSWRLFDGDQTHVLTASLGWKIGRGWSAGGTLRLVSGPLETPVVGSVYDANRDRYRAIYGPTNSERGPMFRRLDLRLEKVWRVGGGHVAAYVDVQNATNAMNEEAAVWSYDYRTRGAIYALPILPSLGVRGEL